MKQSQRKMNRVTVGLVLIALMVSLTACNQPSPLNSANTDAYEQHELNFLSISPSETSLNKGLLPVTDTYTSAYISKTLGGRLHLIYDSTLNLDLKRLGLHAEVTLDFAPYSVDNSTKISLELNDSTFLGNVDMEYSPHGLTFNTPAILNVKGRGFDLSKLDEDILDRVGLYYVNQETGQWEPMKTEAIKIDIEAGSLDIVNAELPHFSRYAVAWSR